MKKTFLLFLAFTLASPFGFATDDYEWADMHSKDLFESSVEAAKGGTPSQVINNAHKLLDQIAKKTKKRELRRAKLKVHKVHKRCHLKANPRHKDMLDKMKALHEQIKGGDCGAQAGPAVAKFGAQISAWEGERDAVEGGCAAERDSHPEWNPRDKNAHMKSCLTAPSYEGLATAKAGAAAGALAQAAESIACAEEMTADEGLNIFGSAIGGVGDLGMLDPGPYGKMAAIGAKGIQGLFSVIAALVKSPWDFRKNEHRESWIGVNCSFLEMNNQLEESGMMSPFTQQESRELKDLTRLIPQLKSVIRNLMVAIEQEEKKMGADKVVAQKAGLEKSLGKATMELYMRLKATTELLQSVSMQKNILNDVKKKGLILKDLFQTYKDFFQLVDQSKLDPDTKKLLLPATKVTFKSIFGGANSEGAVVGKYLNNKKAFKDLTEAFMDPIDWVRDELGTLGDKALSRNKSIADSPTIQRLEVIQDAVQEQLNDLENLQKLFENQRNNKKGGQSAVQEIVKIYQNVEQTIYGKAGVDFMQRMLKHGAQLAQKWQDKYAPMVANMPGNFCQVHARDIKLHYSEFDSFVSTAYDFMRVNNYIFSQEVNGKWLWSRGYQKFLKKQYANSTKIKGILAGPLKGLRGNVGVLRDNQRKQIMGFLTNKKSGFYQPLTTMKKNTPVGNLILRRLLVRSDFAQLAKLAKNKGCNL